MKTRHRTHLLKATAYLAILAVSLLARFVQSGR